MRRSERIPRPRSGPPFILPFVLPFVLLAGVCWMPPAAPSSPGGASAPARPVPARVAPVTVMPVAERIEALGTLQANESVILTASVTETVAALHFADGQRVRAGDLLVELTSTEQRALLDEARVRFDEAERQYRRVETLAGQRAAAASQLDERRRDLDTARALRLALESRLADRLIRAPFDGVLGLRQVSPGTLVAPGEAIVTLDDDHVMKLDVTVSSIHLGALRPGLAIEARSPALGDQVFAGTLQTLDSRVDPVTRALRARAILPNPERRLRPGLLMRVELLVDPRQALVVPESALLHQGESTFAVRIKGGDAPVAERLPVRTGIRLPGWVEIREGLTADDRVVVRGQERLRSGQALQILPDTDGAP